MRKAWFIGILILAVQFPARAQKDSRKDITQIKYQYLELCEFPSYTRKKASVVETDSDDGKKFVIGEVEGSYNGSRLCIIRATTKTQTGRKQQEFYLYEGKLIFVYEREQTIELYTDSTGQGKRNIKTVFECSYYIKNGHVLQRKAKKERDTDSVPSTSVLEKQFSSQVATYTKLLKSAEETPPGKK